MKKYDLYPETSQPHQFDISTATLHSNEEYGAMDLLSSDTITAGEFITCAFEFTAGRNGISPGGRIQIFTDSDSDWDRPQVSDPTGPNYLLIESPETVRIYPHIIDQRAITLRMVSGRLEPGDKIAVTYGDTSHGGPGTRCQTFYESSINFYGATDPDGASGLRVLDNPTKVRIMGGTIEGGSVHAPSDLLLGRPFRLVVKSEDRWGNPAEEFNGQVEVKAPGLNIDSKLFSMDKSCGGVLVLEGCEFREPGASNIEVIFREDGQELVVRSNPIAITEEDVELKLFWGDPHSGQVANPLKIDEYFEYAQNVSAMDYAGFQRNDAQHSTSAYLIQQESEKKYYKPHEFVVLPGFEWSADWEHGGHHNVYFSRFDMPMKRWNGANRVGEPGESDLPHILDLHEYYRSTDTVITPHVGGQHADLQYHDPLLEPALEITSTHGTFEWFLEESLSRGYEMGFLGGNDCHTGRPGDDRPGYQERRYSKGGITGTYARELTLSGILEALKKKRVYATTGAKIRAHLHVDDHFIGSKYLAEKPPKINVKVAGTGPLERIDLFRGTELIHTSDLRDSYKESSVRILWSGASRRWSFSGVVWKGIIKFSNTKLENIERIRFDSPRSHFWFDGDNEIHFESWTCGYPSGFILDFEPNTDPQIVLSLDSYLISSERRFGEDVQLNQTTESVIPRNGLPPEVKMTLAHGDSTRIETTMSEIQKESISLPLGGLNRNIILEKSPNETTTRAEVSFTDNQMKPGTNPYWAKITQQDMEMAWLSPVFADYYPDSTEIE